MDLHVLRRICGVVLAALILPTITQAQAPPSRTGEQGTKGLVEFGDPPRSLDAVLDGFETHAGVLLFSLDGCCLPGLRASNMLEGAP